MRNASAAQFLYEVRLTVPALPPDSIRANDAHLLLAGTGNSIKNVTSKSGVIRTITGTGNGVDLTFSDKLLGGTVIVFHFEADFNNVTFNSGTWTNNGAVIRSLTVTAFGLKPFVGGAGSTSSAGAARRPPDRRSRDALHTRPVPSRGRPRRLRPKCPRCAPSSAGLAREQPGRDRPACRLELCVVLHDQ
ncbi:MAG: hypothetical protein E6K72_05230 [Candidatus Eisenbacteria bacterium]|uniref:Uncharacterized protein n=1 Tax=Eiseniibacteriota bacterium TaxID=2212470 RepID=A0A538SYW3_UNCEI|nr:MAG: hypothetical protein E6K72_05230 [Candidatus Eisenbacteria bacterium]